MMEILHAEHISRVKTGNITEYHNVYPISYANWGAPPKVKADVSIAYDTTNIYLRYNVSENNVLGQYREINDPVFKDSCVEFFISFNGREYYNFEFNCIGTVLAKYGTDRNDRTFLDKEILQTLSINPSLGRNKIKVLDINFHWQLDIIIPIHTFQYTELTDLTGKTARCNFFKCGDDLPEPHFLSWKPILCDTPDFHKSAFFEDIIFS